MTKHRLFVGALALVVAGAGAVLAVWALNTLDEQPVSDRPALAAADRSDVERGAVLAHAGNCAGCHTMAGGRAYAGGRGITTPFGTVYAPNLTPDPATGLGRWSADQFWRALHNGRSRDGRLLYAAFPYPNYTRVTREDADALYAFLRNLPAVRQPNRPHDLRFPYDSQAALAVWRALFFRPGVDRPDAAHDAAWNRGAYLVRGLGHCSACHAERNALGATRDAAGLDGGLIPVQNWYAPSLRSIAEAGVQRWSIAQIVALLRSGVSPTGFVMGPMVEAVRGGTEHLPDADLQAMARYLQTLPTAEPVSKTPAAEPVPIGHGDRLYADHCAACHGDHGEGAAGVYPALAGNRAVVLDPPANLVHIVLEGGFPPATTGNPRPYGMPPFATQLDSDEVAQVLSYVRTAWGNQGSGVSEVDVQRYSGSDAR